MSFVYLLSQNIMLIIIVINIIVVIVILVLNIIFIINPAHRLLKLFVPLLDTNPRDMKFANCCGDNITRRVLYKCPKSSRQSRKLAFLWSSVMSNFCIRSSVPLMPLLLRFTAAIVVHNSSKQNQLSFWLGSISVWRRHYSDTNELW